ncbi:MAG: Rieske (2Fe-2S) protein [Deinococcus sp.]|nr:Rieske (2Fe-2S) protein [Deinococcus sp.]
METAEMVKVGAVGEVQAKGCVVVPAGGHAVAVFYHQEKFYAVDNRCPHMGFPLDKGTVQDGVLTCHWHHARFDLSCGGTFDPWADDVRSYPVEVRDGTVYLRLTPPAVDPLARWQRRLEEGLEQNLSLVVAKAVIGLLDAKVDYREVVHTGAQFGTTYRRDGWGSGLTILTAMANLLPALEQEDRFLALFHGLSRVAQDTQGQAPRFPQPPLANSAATPEQLKGWFRQFIEVRDDQGAERCLVSAVQAGLSPQKVADMLFAAATDHYYLNIGHVLDFINKAFEMLDHIGWEHAAQTLSSLTSQLAEAPRSEESNEWQHPVNLVDLLEEAFAQLPRRVQEGARRQGQWQGQRELTETLLRDNPKDIVAALNAAVQLGATPAQLGRTVAYAAAMRIARFPLSNEFGDWDTVHHTFTYCNALHQALQRAPSPELLRGVYHAAMSIYLDRFLNVPPASLPEPASRPPKLEALLDLLDRQQQVNQAGTLAYQYLTGGGDPAKLVQVLGHALLREDAGFHSFQAVEAGWRQASEWGNTPEGRFILTATTRWLAAHVPTPRAALQTARIALRLHRGEELYQEG